MSNAEWDIFKRIENLEQDIETAKPTLKDANTVALFAFGLAFGALTMHSPDHARKAKDSCLRTLKTLDLSPGILNKVEQVMLEVCDIGESSSR